jgi:acyl-CoA thioester hydrolase
MSVGQTLECRVYFEDTDAGGVVYHANYLNFYERARTEFLRTLGFEQDDLLLQNIVFVVRNITVDFKQAARFNELLLVESHIKRLKKVSLIFDQAIYSQRGEKKVLINQAEVKVGCVSADQFVPVAIPEQIMRKLSNYE